MRINFDLENLKEGDLVRIRPDLHVASESEYGEAVTEEMIEFAGQVAKIETLYDDGDIDIDLDNDNYYWTREMLCSKCGLLTFEEVMKYGEAGDEFIDDYGSHIYEKIKINSNKVEFIGDEIESGKAIPLGKKMYKLVEQKKFQLYNVEHEVGGTKYTFQSKNKLNVGDIVECDTCRGTSYGRITDVIVKTLSLEELEKIKYCRRA